MATRRSCDYHHRKYVAVMALTLAFRYPLNAAPTIAASLAQIVEFSFVLAGLDMAPGILPAAGMSVILAGAFIFIALNLLVFSAIKPLKDFALRHSRLARELESRTDLFAELPRSTERQYLEGQVVLGAYGRVGRRIAEALTKRGNPYVLAEQNREVVVKLRNAVMFAVSGGTADPSVLIQAHITNAALF